MTEKILIERRYRVNLDNFDKRKRFLGQVAASINNELIENLSPNEKSKLYANLTSVVKLYNDIERDSLLEQHEARLIELEKSLVKK